MPEWSHAASASAATAKGIDVARRGEEFAREFDARLAGRVSLLTDYSPHAPRVVADAYRAVLASPKAHVPTKKRSTACSIPRATRIAWKRSTSACTRRSCARVAAREFHVRENQPHRR